VEKFICEGGFTASWTIEPLSDRYGPAVEADFDALVVSEETLPVGMEINVLRRKKGKRKVDIHQIACVLAEDGRWISSTRIYRGEIDSQGHLLHRKTAES
jgi:pantetheine-phosphate adenylyltransferase